MQETDPKKMTKAERLHWSFGTDALIKAETEILNTLMVQNQMPAEWHEIWEERDRRDPKRTRVTISLDADVVKFFRAMGLGYGPRINRILRAYMHMRLAKMITGPDTSDFVLRPEAVMARARRRADWGDVAAGMAGWEGAEDPAP